jgi:hypothetical protein
MQSAPSAIPPPPPPEEKAAPPRPRHWPWLVIVGGLLTVLVSAITAYLALLSTLQVRLPSRRPLNSSIPAPITSSHLNSNAPDSTIGSDETALRTLVTQHAPSSIDIPPTYQLNITRVATLDDWATIDCSFISRSTGEPVPAGGILILGHRNNGTWALAFQGTDLYNAWLETIPTDLVPLDLRPFLK